jgi:hypothetical protein
VESITYMVALSIPDQKKIETAKGVTYLLPGRLAVQALIG